MKTYNISFFDLDSYKVLTSKGYKGSIPLGDLPISKERSLTRIVMGIPSEDLLEELEEGAISPFYGTKDKVYGPTLIQHKGELGLNVGLCFVPLDLSNLVPDDQVTAEYSIEDVRAYGYPAKAFCLEILTSDSEGKQVLITAKFLIRFQDLEYNKKAPQEIKNLLKTGKLEILGEMPKGSSGEFQETYAARVLEPGHYQVKDVRSFVKKNGQRQYVLELNTEGKQWTPVRDDGSIDLLNPEDINKDSVCVYAPNEANDLLSLYGDSYDSSYNWDLYMLTKAKGSKPNTVRCTFNLTTDQPFKDDDDEVDDTLEDLLA